MALEDGPTVQASLPLSSVLGSPPPRAGSIHTLLCTSQGLVMAERSQAVIIMALHTGHPPLVQGHLKLRIPVNSISLSFLHPYKRGFHPDARKGLPLPHCFWALRFNPASVSYQRARLSNQPLEASVSLSIMITALPAQSGYQIKWHNVCKGAWT
jgi:hypothetical protein